MTLSKAALALYTRSSRTTSREDRRVGAKHDRHARSFIRKQYGDHTIRFYPLKEWPRVVGVTNKTLRTWLQQRVLSAYTMHRMYVMCLAEQMALAAVVRRHHQVTRHGEITPEFTKDVADTLREVRLALDVLGSPKHKLSEAQYALVLPSINDR